MGMCVGINSIQVVIMDFHMVSGEAQPSSVAWYE